ncbi:ATP binding protein [Cordyceps fumosorosea ARSEF 2679]|uniref:GPN-loop GTPase n=1 Tax=Cordyceps fumosorosea (strain ARSEF 2679) TaxID=1081104 RepID=A0A167LVF6_CORFA|nr:ATP binding protein [Cordyceps fumosorosea ARSEF 2679]OAA53562.1 ATP binding protein [Cordyceps fumosorosea ARSEF 2679]
MASETTSAANASGASSASSPVAIVCVGMAGSGKTTFMQRINAYLHEKETPPYVMNLDPAVMSVPFESNIDIRDSVNYEEVMKQYNLGPNGGILTSLNLFATKVDQVVNLLEKRTKPDPENPQKKPIRNILVDTPGQIEVFVWSASGTILLESLASSFPTVIAYVIDTPRTSSTSTFMSNMLYACSILYKTKLPMILVFNKTDVKDAEFAREWMTDFEAFQEALRRDEESDALGGGPEGVGGHGGSGYMGSLLNSMSLVLEEFYAHLSMVGVSARAGTGVDDFFAAVEEKRLEFLRDYQPELERRRAERDSEKKKARDRELDRMMQDMAVGGGGDGAGAADEDVDVESSGDDEDSGDEATKKSLQERYQAALGDNEDSVLADASFAKYLHTQR